MSRATRAAVLALLSAAFAAACSIERAPVEESQGREIVESVRAIFAHGARAWNAGDLDGFVSDYADSATYVSARGLAKGRASIRERYAPRFAPGAVRDSLSFENIQVDVLSRDLAHAIAWYVLMRGDSVTARGPTSLLMRRLGGRWLIVHDHSS